MNCLKRQQTFGGHVREDNLVEVLQSAGCDTLLQPATDFAPEWQRQTVQINRFVRLLGVIDCTHDERVDSPGIIERHGRSVHVWKESCDGDPIFRSQ
jgi:hypothetical protein